MEKPEIPDSLFLEAISAIDKGEVDKLEHLLITNPGLAKKRLETVGKWFGNIVGETSEGYFKQPYLLWFIAGNPVRIDKLPSNIAAITSVIIRAIKREAADSLQHQLDYTLGLVATGRIPRECGVQIGLIDLLIDAGAKPGTGIGALAHGNLDAAEHLIARGGKATLAVAICLERMDEVMRLAKEASAGDLQTALAAAAFYGKATMVNLLIGLGVEIDAYPDTSTGFHSHATALHQAVFSGSLEAVKVLVGSGAKTEMRDRIYKGTPLDWAEYMCAEENDKDTKRKFSAIAEYLHSRK